MKQEAFVDDTAAKSGRSRTAVARDATRAKALGPDLDRVTGTSLDKGAELDALVAMPTTEAYVPDLTFRGGIKLNPRFRLHRGYGALASLAPDIAPFGFTMARSSRQDIRRGGFVHQREAALRKLVLVILASASGSHCLRQSSRRLRASALKRNSVADRVWRLSTRRPAELRSTARSDAGR
ncbi:hypothetical protein [Bradyrhizobium sp. SSUT77]|uniref:hypothetical protein n=1 Tax=Bradyrhizobium sp. SSUT77 TaxID=3040603 RepID=UPI0024480FC9|nr:hypothetical protein [Bradyrhizobium sp. SSUT77]MDH2341513.1 hypothetical protein [Bradyrhizobium sp. SSUT77]